MSGLEELTREELIELVLKLHETGWREDGVNGYLWSFSTPQVRYYTYRGSRGSVVVKEVLTERMERFLGELFTFVQWPDVPSENNPAERAIGPAVVARKISGGTRSPKGSKTSSVLRTLFETWTPRGCNALDTCRQMLIDYNNRPAQSAAA